MFKRRQNVWRVYMDLLLNFMGLVLIGGGGLMVLVGGAVLHDRVGPASFARRCLGGTWVQRGDLPMNLEQDGRRKVSRRVQTCSVEGRNPDVVFAVGESDAVRQMSLIQQTTCTDLFDAVNFLKRRQIDGGIVEIVGRASDDYADTNKCGRSPDEVFRGLLTPEQQRLLNCESCTPEARQNIRLALAAAFETQRQSGGSQVVDRTLCNTPLAIKRAMSVQRICYIWADSPDRPKDAPSEADLSSLVIPTLDPTRNDELCGDGSGSDCMRTVSIRVRLPNYVPKRRMVAKADSAVR